MKKRTTRVMSALRLRIVQLAAACALAAPLGLSAAPTTAPNPKLEPFKHIAGAEKVDLNLLRAGEMARSKRVSLGEHFEASDIYSKRGRAILVEVRVDAIDDAIRRDVEASGLVVLGTLESPAILTLAVDSIEQLEYLAKDPRVHVVKPVYKPITRRSGASNRAGSVESLADFAMKSDLARAKWNVSGAGQEVAIISDSYAVTPEVGGTFGQVLSYFEVSTGVAYTLVVQTSEPTQLQALWETFFVAGITDFCTIVADEQNDLCNSRTPLGTGVVGNSQARPTVPLADGDTFPEVSCFDVSGENFALFCFRSAGTGLIELQVNTASPADVAISLRTVCDDASTEICAAEEFAPPDGATNLIFSNPQITNDLPPNGSILIFSEGPSSGTDEGAAMGELVFDVAPGAGQWFHTGIPGQAQFAAAVQAFTAYALRLQGQSDIAGALPPAIIVDDIGYLDEPVYQESVASSAARAAIANHIPFYSAAGNYADLAIRQHYRDASSGEENAFPPQGGDLHVWATGSSYLPLTLAPNSQARIGVHWNQPSVSASQSLGVGSQIDLDAYILSAPNADAIREALLNPVTGGDIFVSNSSQGISGFPSGDAFEFLVVTNLSPAERTYYLAVDHWRGSRGSIPQGGALLELAIIMFADGDVRLPAGVGGPSIFGHASAPGVMAVGAVNWFDTPAFDTTFGPTNAIDPEPFTAKGGELEIQFDRFGEFNPVTVFKPDISGVDGNNTTFFDGPDFDLDGHPNFFGTSAAAPNVAAVVALIRELNPFLTPAQINRVLEITALDVTGERAAPGKDDVSGAGLVDALAAADFIAENYGVFDPMQGQASRNRLFAYDSNAEGWTFEGPSPFTAPTADASTGRLNMRSTGNTNTFGLWKSPEFIAFPYNQPDPGDGTTPPTAIDGISGPTSLYRLTAVVSTDQPSASTVPVARMRTGTSSFEQSDAMVITSTGNSALSPASGARKTYRHYFTLPDTQRRFRGYFDMLNFDPSDAAFARLSLDESIFQAFDTSVLLNGQLERLWLFNQNTSGWSVRNAPPFATPGSSSTGGLTLGPAGSGGSASFAFWGSPEGQGITLRQGRIYKATFRVASSAGAESVNRVPTFRCRVNDATNQFSAYVNAESIDNASRVPGGGVALDYTVFFEVPAEMVGRQVNFSFDYIFDPGTNNDPGATVTLQSLRVDSYTAPL